MLAAKSVEEVRPSSLELSGALDKSHPAGLAELFDEHAPFLVRVVTRMLGTQDRAEDVVQRTFLTAHRKGLPPGSADHGRAWLYRVAMNEVRHERRSWARRLLLRQALDAEPWPESTNQEEGLLRRQTAERVRAAVAMLPEKQREVFVLYELEDLSGSEIAALLGVPENTVWSRLRLARKRFEEIWPSEGKTP